MRRFLLPLAIVFVFFVVGLLQSGPSTSVVQAAPSITVSPTSGPAGTPITVTGTGFLKDDGNGTDVPVTSLTVTFGSVSICSGTSVPDSGDWSCSYTVPSGTSAGSKTITATGDGTITESDTFTVTAPQPTEPTISITGPGGSIQEGAEVRFTLTASPTPTTSVTVTVEISGGASVGVNNQTRDLIFQGNTSTTSLTLSTSDDNVNESAASLTVTLQEGNGYVVGSPRSASVEVTDDDEAVTAPKPNISLATNSGPVGQTVTVTGSNFLFVGPDQELVPVSSVTVEFGSGGARRTVSNISERGRWTVNLSVPSVAGGFQTVRAEATELDAPLTADFEVISEVTMTPTSGSVGDRVTVTGRGFRSREPVDIIFDNETIESTLAGPTGAVRFEFEVPAVGAGTYNVEVGQEHFQFKITSSFVVAPASGPSGTSVTVTGNGFNPNSTGDLRIGSTVIQSVTTTSDGRLEVNISIPQIPGGKQNITTTNFGSASAQFTVTPTLALDRTKAAPGTRVNVSGTGFGRRESNIRVRFDNTVVASGVTADETGRWSTSFQMPVATAGTHRVRASGPTTTEGSVPSLTMAVAAGFELAQTSSGAPGTVVPLRGSGSRSNETITIIVGDNLATAQAKADSKGVWLTQVTIPPAPRGPLTIVARGTASEPLTNTFNVVPAFTIAQRSGIPGGPITATGEGFGANQADISLTFGGEVIATVNANARGSWTASVPVPTLPRGSYTVEVPEATAAVPIPFNVMPIIVLANTQATPLASVSIAGSGFGANERGIEVTLGANEVASGISADANGSWNSTFLVPEMPSGQYSIHAYGPQTTSDSVERQVLSIKPLVELNVDSGPTGTGVNITGLGFDASARSIEVRYDDTPVAMGISTDARGKFTANFEVPPSAAGIHEVTVSRTTGAPLSSPVSEFQVVPHVGLSVLEGPPGTSVTIRGTGFGVNEANIVLTYGDDELSTNLTADGQGSFTERITIPSSPSGTHRIRASSSFAGPSAHLERPFKVTPALSLSDASGNIGDTVEIIGRGFEGDKNVSISYDGDRLESVTTDASGSFLTDFDVPISMHGEHLLEAGDASGNRISVTFSVEDTPPPIPALMSPEDGAIGGLFGGFQPSPRWTGVEDPSGVTYSLVIARDKEFQDIVLEKSGLPAPTYSLGDEEKLERGKYYWRVRAVDQASNSSEWTEEFLVQSGVVPVWLAFLLVGLALAASGGGGYAFLRYRRKPATQPMIPDMVQITRPALGGTPAAPSQAPASLPPAAPPQLQAPPPTRRALPNPFQRSRGPSPEDQARLQMATDFVRAIPILEVSPDLSWLEELTESMGDNPDDVYQHILLGQQSFIYQPAWTQHPTYMELRGYPQSQAFFQNLDEYVAAVNECAVDTTALLQQIYRDITIAGVEEGLQESQWRFVLSVAQSSIAWFRGTYLGQPSNREYEMAPALGVAEDALMSLHWVNVPSLGGVLVEGVSQEEVVFYRDLHIRLRNVYRSSEQARLLTAKLAATDALRAQLAQAISQLGQS